jgi:hypothetical protein
MDIMDNDWEDIFVSKEPGVLVMIEGFSPSS